MKITKFSLATLAFGIPLALVGCTDSGTAVEDASTPQDGTTTADSSVSPPADSGSDAIAVGDSSSPPPPTDGGSDSSATDSGGSVTDSGTAVDSGSAGNDGGDGGGLCAAIQGSFQATQVACSGADAGFASSGVTWDFTVSGASGTFVETVEGCGLTSGGTVTCSNGVFTVLTSNENSCNPAGCAIWGSQCTETPNAPLVWSISDVTATTFLATSQNEPDGGPTPLTTCTSLHESNPIQVTWTRQ